MEAFNPSQWRTRLAIAMLSERVRPKSFFYPYLSNLPFEVWGLPFFFNMTEFELIQDPSLMQSQIERCKFLQEFTKDVLVPMSKSQQEAERGMCEFGNNRCSDNGAHEAVTAMREGGRERYVKKRWGK